MVKLGVQVAQGGMESRTSRQIQAYEEQQTQIKQNQLDDAYQRLNSAQSVDEYARVYNSLNEYQRANYPTPEEVAAQQPKPTTPKQGEIPVKVYQDATIEAQQRQKEKAAFYDKVYADTLAKYKEIGMKNPEQAARDWTASIASQRGDKLEWETSGGEIFIAGQGYSVAPELAEGFVNKVVKAWANQNVRINERGEGVSDANVKQESFISENITKPRAIPDTFNPPKKTVLQKAKETGKEIISIPKYLLGWGKETAISIGRGFVKSQIYNAYPYDVKQSIATNVVPSAARPYVIAGAATSIEHLFVANRMREISKTPEGAKIVQNWQKKAIEIQKNPFSDPDVSNYLATILTIPAFELVPLNVGRGIVWGLSGASAAKAAATSGNPIKDVTEALAPAVFMESANALFKIGTYGVKNEKVVGGRVNYREITRTKKYTDQLTGEEGTVSNIKVWRGEEATIYRKTSWFDRFLEKRLGVSTRGYLTESFIRQLWGAKTPFTKIKAIELAKGTSGFGVRGERFDVAETNVFLREGQTEFKSGVTQKRAGSNIEKGYILRGVLKEPKTGSAITQYSPIEQWLAAQLPAKGKILNPERLVGASEYELFLRWRKSPQSKIEALKLFEQIPENRVMKGTQVSRSKKLVETKDYTVLFDQIVAKLYKGQFPRRAGKTIKIEGFTGLGEGLGYEEFGQVIGFEKPMKTGKSYNQLQEEIFNMMDRDFLRETGGNQKQIQIQRTAEQVSEQARLKRVSEQVKQNAVPALAELLGRTQRGRPKIRTTGESLSMQINQMYSTGAFAGMGLYEKTSEVGAVIGRERVRGGLGQVFDTPNKLQDRVRTLLGTPVIPKSSQLMRTMSLTRNTELPRINEIIRSAEATLAINVPRIAQVPRITQVPKITETPRVTQLPSTPSFPNMDIGFPSIPPIPMPSFSPDFSGSSVSGGKKKKRKKLYVPDFTSRILGLQMKVKGMKDIEKILETSYSGFELRPSIKL